MSVVFQSIHKQMKYIIILSLLFLVACSTTQKVSTVVVDVPFSDASFLSDNICYRYVQSATNSNLVMSEKLAMINAKTGLASLISSNISSISENYISASTINGNEEIVEQFREVINTVIKQDLINVVVLGQETRTEEDGKYTTWVAVEVPIIQVKRQMQSELSSHPELGFDEATFEQVFENNSVQ